MRVLLSTDDSTGARTAEGWVTRTHWSQPPLVDVVCVAGRGTPRFGWSLQTYREPVRLAVDGLRENEGLAAQRLANEVGVRLQRAGLTVRTWARQGDTHRELLAMVAAEGPDLIVVGPRGRSALASALLGSLTANLAEDSPVPVLVAKRPVSPDRPLPDHLVLVVDGSSQPDQAIKWLRQIGWLTDTRVTLLGMSGGGRDDSGGGTRDPASERRHRDLMSTLDASAKLLRDIDRVDVSVDVAAGFTPSSVTDALVDLDADVVVILRSTGGGVRNAMAFQLASQSSVATLVVPAG